MEIVTVLGLAVTYLVSNIIKIANMKVRPEPVSVAIPKWPIRDRQCVCNRCSEGDFNALKRVHCNEAELPVERIKVENVLEIGPGTKGMAVWTLTRVLKRQHVAG